MRVGVLASGSGSNFSALVDGLNLASSPARVEVLICNVPGAGVLERAAKANVPSVVIDHKAFADRAAFDSAIVAALREHRIDLVCLAGFMRLIGPALLSAFPQKLVNVHPALLPSFPGLHGARQALEHGARVAGCTVHFVDAGTDTGPIIAQAAVPVLETDDEATLQQRIQQHEHRLFPEAVRRIALGQVRVEGRRVFSGGLQ